MFKPDIESYLIEYLKFPGADKYLIPDGRWESWRGIMNHRAFVENCVPKLQIKKNAPDHVKEAFEIVNYLHVFAYYKYEFFDVAYGKALQIMEMAFKLKYQEITGKIWDIKEKPLKQLINFLYSHKVFDSHILQIYALKDSRNRELHPVFNSFSGNTFYRRIHHVLQVINELYEDMPLRLQRLKLMEEFEEFMKDAKDGIELVKNGKRHSLYHLYVQVIDNKGVEPIYHVVAVPPFSLARYLKKDLNGRIPRIIAFSLLKVELKNGIFSGFDLLTQTQIIFQKIENDLEIIKFREWKTTLENIQFRSFIDHGWAGIAGSLHFERQYEFTIK
ncbi:MAG TPA: hypothetical protein VK806_07180 [Bacteroidia bacterium]|jgi:hypothetical protein|nr:hypothetical protein [Bacteroidia bacterium]